MAGLCEVPSSFLSGLSKSQDSWPILYEILWPHPVCHLEASWNPQWFHWETTDPVSLLVWQSLKSLFMKLSEDLMEKKMGSFKDLALCPDVEPTSVTAMTI